MLFPWADLGCPEGIAIDHMSRNMYWTDSILDRIEVSRLDGSQRRVLFDDDLINPRPIIADPAYGYVCVWSRRYEEHTLIYDTHTALRPPDTCTGPTGTATGPRSSAPVWTGATGRCWCRTGWGCPTLWPLTPRAGGSAGRTQVSFTFIQQHASWITLESCLLLLKDCEDILFLYNNVTDESFTISPEVWLFCRGAWKHFILNALFILYVYFYMICLFKCYPFYCFIHF